MSSSSSSSSSQIPRPVRDETIFSYGNCVICKRDYLNYCHANERGGVCKYVCCNCFWYIYINNLKITYEIDEHKERVLKLSIQVRKNSDSFSTIVRQHVR
jgi:hypothetical protein